MLGYLLGWAFALEGGSIGDPVKNDLLSFLTGPISEGVDECRCLQLIQLGFRLPCVPLMFPWLKQFLVQCGGSLGGVLSGRDGANNDDRVLLEARWLFWTLGLWGAKEALKLALYPLDKDLGAESRDQSTGRSGYISEKMHIVLYLIERDLVHLTTRVCRHS